MIFIFFLLFVLACFLLVARACFSKTNDRIDLLFDLNSLQGKKISELEIEIIILKAKKSKENSCQGNVKSVENTL
jgi:hypothetical protein